MYYGDKSYVSIQIADVLLFFMLIYDNNTRAKVWQRFYTY